MERKEQRSYEKGKKGTRSKTPKNVRVEERGHRIRKRKTTNTRKEQALITARGKNVRKQSLPRASPKKNLMGGREGSKIKKKGPVSGKSPEKTERLKYQKGLGEKKRPKPIISLKKKRRGNWEKGKDRPRKENLRTNRHMSGKKEGMPLNQKGNRPGTKWRIKGKLPREKKKRA